MTPIYLTRFALSEFRAFSRLEIRLPPTPGALIVSGSNGLGKSSLFDGLEWCLAGEIEAFADAKKSADPLEYLRRWHANAARKTVVEMEFSDRTTVVRDLPGGLRSPIEAAQLGELMKCPEWPGHVGDLHRHLLLTHFLGQSSATRMTHREARERWEFLKGPTQSDWAIEIATILHGHGNTTVAGAYESQAKEFDQRADVIEALLSNEELQFQGARVEGALDDAATKAAAEALEVELHATTLGIGFDFPATTQRSSTASQMLERIQNDLATAWDRLRQRAATIERAVGVFEAHIQAQGEIPALEAASTEAEIAETAVASIRDEAKHALDKALASIAQAEAVVRPLQTRLEKLERLRALVVRDGMLQIRSEPLEAEIRIAEADLAEAEGRVSQADRRRKLASTVAVRLAGLTHDSIRETELQQKLSVLETLIARWEAAETDLDLHRSMHPDLEIAVAAAYQQLESFRQAEATATASLRQARSTVDELARAVAAIAAHLRDEMYSCPVCATQFAAKDELRRRAVDAGSRLAPTLAPFEKTLADVERAREEAEESLTRLLIVEAERRNLANAAEAIQLDLTSQRNTLLTEQDGHTFELAAARAAVEARLEVIERRRHRMEAWRNHPLIGDEATTREAWSAAVQLRNDSRDTLVNFRAELHQSDAERRALAAEMVATALDLGLEPPNSEAEVVPLHAAMGAQLQAANETLDAATQAAEAAQHRLGEVERSLQAAGQRTITAKSALAARRGALGRAEADWVTLNIGSDIPSADLLTQAQRSLSITEGRLQTMAYRLTELRAGLGLWVKQQAHRQTIDQLSAALSLKAPRNRDVLRAVAVQNQSDFLARAQSYRRAKAIAQATFHDVIAQVEDFNDRYLRPLNRLMNNLNRAILTEPEVGLELTARGRRVQQTALKSPQAPLYVKQLDPHLVHSEGQMAALAVSMLCAASLTFPWSRWPALVLDDPLEHNDVVHASAFADMLRNLIHAKGYQIFLSTHDVAQADFLRRKFRAGEVPCTTVHLIGQGDLGTEAKVEGTIHDLSARRA
jgi:exonuclease SbcC